MKKLKNSILKRKKTHRKFKVQYPRIDSWPHDHVEVFHTAAVWVLARQDRAVAANTHSLESQHLLPLRKSTWPQLQRTDLPGKLNSALTSVWVSEHGASHTEAHTRYVRQTLIRPLGQCWCPSLQSWRLEINSIFSEGSKLSLIQVTPNPAPLQK